MPECEIFVFSSEKFEVFNYFFSILCMNYINYHLHFKGFKGHGIT